tara:strand:+ start:6149 stop:6388 length:240 start_codon:yes stop_codon:yes gene_type:complete
MSDQSFRDLIQIILEDLSKVKGSSKGYGTAQLRVVGAGGPMLGDIEVEDKGEGDIEQKTPVKVSKAFLKAQWIDDPGTA